MKKMLSVAFVGVTLLFAFNLTAAETTLKESVFPVLGIKGGLSSLETDYNTFLPTPDDVNKLDASNLASIFETYNVYTTGVSNDQDEFNTGYANVKYATKVANMEKIVRDSYEKIKAAEKIFGVEYATGDAEVNKILEQYLAYQKAVTQLLECKNKEFSVKLLKDDTVTETELKNKTKLANKAAQDAYDTFTESLAKVPDAKKESVLNQLRRLNKDIKVSTPNFEVSDLIPAKDCNKKDTPDCEKQANAFLKHFIDKGEQPSYGTVYVKNNKSCVMDKIMKTLGSAFKFGQLFCDRQIRKRGMLKADNSPNTTSLACLSAYKHLSSTENNTLLQPYIEKLDNANTMNLQMLTHGASETSSLDIGGSTPSDVLSTDTETTDKGTTGTETGSGAETNVKKSSISNFGDGVTRYNANQAVSSFYDPAITTYKNMAKNANTLISSVKPINATISNYNDELTSAMVSSNSKIASLPQTESNWAISTMNANTSATQAQQRDALRLEFSRQQAQMQSIITQMDLTQRKLGLAKFNALYGNETASAAAMQDVAAYTVSLKMLQSQGLYAQTRLGLLMGTLGLGRYRYGYSTDASKAIFNINYMYASNENKNMPKALKLENIKTPITLKKGWENDFKKYIEEMSQKSAEAKKAMNEAKAKIKELLVKNLPSVSLEKLPQPGEIRDELINMQSIKLASLKNLGVINSAMTYHNSRRNAYAPEQYSTFKHEQETVNGALRRTISSINAAEESVSEANNVISSLNQEVPKAEALKAVARQMVAQGL